MHTNKFSFRLTTQQTVKWYIAAPKLSGSVLHMQPSTGLRAKCKVGQLFGCKYGCHGYVQRRLAFAGLLVLLTSKTLFSTSIRGITLSIGAVDSALMLRVVPAESALSTDRGQPSLPRKLQRSAPPTAR